MRQLLNTFGRRVVDLQQTQKPVFPRSIGLLQMVVTAQDIIIIIPLLQMLR